jgi:hypothetical protein
MITTNDILARLRNGESMDTIGQSIADVLNEAQEAYIAEQAVKAKEAEAAAMAQTKREMASDMVDIIRAYGHMVAPDAADILDDIDDDDIDAMVATLDEMFHMMTTMAQLKHDIENGMFGKSCTQIPECKPVTKPAKSDDEVLANFIKTLM